MLAPHGDITYLIWYTRCYNVDAAGAEEFIGLLLQIEQFARSFVESGGIGSEPLNQLAGVDLDARHLDHFPAVEVHLRKAGVERVIEALDLYHFQFFGSWRGYRSADIVRVNQALGSQRIAITDEQLHGFLDREAIASIQHHFFRVGEIHFTRDSL